METPVLGVPPLRACQLPAGRCSEDGHIARKLWFRFSHIINVALVSPFAICLAAGDLEIDDFAHFVSQDKEILKAFTIALQVAADNADDDEARLAFSQLRTDLAEIRTRHMSFLREYVPDITLDSDVHPATKRYTDLLLGTVAVSDHMPDAERKKIPAYVVAVTAASLRMCTFLAEKVKNVLDAEGDTNRYRNWIEYYAADSFKELSQKIEDLLERLHVSLPSDEHEFLESLYHLTIQRGVDIMSQQLIHQSSVAPLIRFPSAEYRLTFFSNFNKSCTLVDSSQVLAEYAIDSTTPKSLQDKSEGRFVMISTDEMRKIWKKIEDDYRDGHRKHCMRILRAKNVKKFSYEHVVKSVQPLSDFDEEANCKVLDSGLLHGLKLKQIKRLGETLALNSGCLHFFRSLLNDKRIELEVHMLSRCWCADMITSAFAQARGMNFFANELVYKREDLDTSAVGILKLVTSSNDKVKLFRSILKNTPTNKQNRTVYVGHTLDDFLCLLEADIGIVFDCNRNLEVIGEKLKVSFVPLFPGLVKKQKEHAHRDYFSSNSKNGVLYTVTSWAEIHAFVLGAEGQPLGC